MPRPICLRLFWHWARAAASRTFCTAGTSKPIKMAMMAMTTSSSINVNPERFRRIETSRPRSGVWSALGDVNIELVRTASFDLDFLLALGVVVPGDALLGHREGRAGEFARRRVLLGVAGSDDDLVLAGLEALHLLDGVLALL